MKAGAFDHLIPRGVPIIVSNPTIMRIASKTPTIVKNTGRGFHNGRRMKVNAEYSLMTTMMTIVKKVCVCPSTFHNGAIFS